MSEIDLSAISVWFDGDPDLSARQWLEGQRDQLEALVEPCLSDKPTKFSLTFRGQKRYIDASRTVKVGSNGSPDARISILMLADALSYLYGLQEAIESGDIDAIINKTYGFSKCRAEIESVEIWGMRPTFALAATRRHQSIQSGRRKGKGTLGDRERAIVVAFVKKQARVVGSSKKAAEMAADQLRTGTFRGIKHRVDDIEAGTIRSWLYPRKPKL